MDIINWYLWRRWLLIRNIRGTGVQVDIFLSNCWKINYARCQQHPVIWHDMQKIVRDAGNNLSR
ncbi:hypothetical protein CSM15_003332 [Salmonella enterica subsp. diarizonae]|nr:hypothetical protein [Salmonella enterica]EDU7995054.1 hypothetical protein [Salmonella enterica subsp. diarizonae]EHV3427514.1 hypothetical protein [Salmonella enterica]